MLIGLPQDQLRGEWMKNAILLILSLFYVGCAFDSTSSEINQRENKTIEEKNRVLRNNYGLVTGFYQGKLRLANEERMVTLGIYTLEVKEGTNSSGEPIFKPVLNAVYRQIYPVEVPIVLDGRYVPETGELSFINANSIQSMDSLHTINASINGSKILGVVKTPTGVLGDLDLDFIQKKVDAPLEGDADHIAEKLRQQFEIITGTYVGKLKSSGAVDSSNQTEWDIELGIYTLEVKAGTKPNGEVIFRPILKAVFKQHSPVVPNLILDAQFIAETGQVFFVNPNAGLSDLHTINAKLNQKTIQGSAKKASGLWGQLHLEFTTKNVNTDPSGDENEFNRKLREQYQKLTGTYRGTIVREGSGEQPSRVWEVELGLYIIDVKYGTLPTGEPKLRPALKARFKQLAPLAPNVLLDVQYVAESEQLMLSVAGGDSSSSSDGLNSITGSLKDNVIAGTASKASGYWGELRLNFVSKNVDTDPSGDENEYNRRLREQYQKLTGTYRGQILREASGGEPRREWKVELGLYIIDVKYGTLPSGEPKLRPALKARFKQLAPVAPNVLLDVQYVAETEQLFLSVSGGDTLPGASEGLNSITSALKNNVISGTASKASGYWGELNLKFITKSVDTPSSGDQEDYNRRLAEEFQTLVGSYTGTVSPEGRGLEPFNIEVKVFIVQEVAAGGTTPKLKAYYHRTSDRFNATDLTMNVEYKTELTPAGVDMSGQRSSGALTYFVVLNGQFQNKQIRGQYHDQRGQSGPFRLKRVSTR